MNPSESNSNQSNSKKRLADEMVINDEEEGAFKKTLYIKEAFVTPVTDSNKCTFIHFGKY
jgi:hypothetical protein